MSENKLCINNISLKEIFTALTTLQKSNLNTSSAIMNLSELIGEKIDSGEWVEEDLSEWMEKVINNIPPP